MIRPRPVPCTPPATVPSAKPSLQRRLLPLAPPRRPAPLRAAPVSAAAMPRGAAPAVAVVTTQGCPYCRRAKADLAAAGIPFAEIAIAEDQPGVLAAVKAASGQPTVPQVFVGGRLLGGSTDVAAGLADGSLAAAVAAAAGQPPLPPAVQAAVDAAGAGAGPAAPAAPSSSSAEAFRDEARAAGLGGSPGATFSAAAALQWLQEGKGLAPAAAAAALGAAQAANALAIAAGASPTTPLASALSAPAPSAAESLQLRWVADVPAPASLSAPLNAHYRWFGSRVPAVEVSARLRRQILGLYETHMTADGSRVNYRGMARDPGFKGFVDAAAELQAAEVAGMGRAEAMCFWINVYNALVVHATAAVGPAAGTLARLRWYEEVAYDIGGARFSLNDIEHGVLRGNAPSPASLLSLLGAARWAPPTFPPSDPRAALALAPVDPRIHFALNCGATSCPPIRVYSPERLEEGLEGAAAAFCASEVEVASAAGPAPTLRLSSIFKWYGGDFGTKADLLRFLEGHIPAGAAREAVAAALAAGGPGGERVRLEYKPYDWNVNSVE